MATSLVQLVSLRLQVSNSKWINICIIIYQIRLKFKPNLENHNKIGYHICCVHLLTMSVKTIKVGSRAF